MPRVEFEGQVHDFPADFTDADIAAALGGPKSAPKPAAAPSAVTQGYDALRSGVIKGADALLDWTPGARKAAGMPSPGEQIGGWLPKSVTGGLAETGVGLATGGVANRVPVLNGLPAPLRRILVGAAGGEVGGQLEDRRTGAGALQGGGSAALGEVLGKALGPIIGALPGGKGLANRADAARVGQAIEDISPPLAGARTTGDIRGLAEGGGREALGRAKEDATRRIEGMLPGNSGTFIAPGSIPMPSMATSARVGTTPASPTRPITQPVMEGGGVTVRPGGPVVRSGVYGEEMTPMPQAVVDPGRVVNRPTGERAFTGEGTQVAAPVPITAGRSTVPFREANAELSDVGARAFSKNPLDRTANGLDQRQLYGTLRKDIVSGLREAGGEAPAAAFNAAQDAHKGGQKLLDYLTKSGVSDSNGMLNMTKLQAMLNNPKNVAALQRSLGPENFAKLEAAVTRGAGRGETDKMASGKGGMFDALMQVLRGTNTGASQTWRVPIATIFPNIGSQYIGRHPLAVPEESRPLFDLLFERGTDALVNR